MFTVVPWDHNLAFGVMNGRRAADAVPAMQTEQSGQTGVGAGTAGAGAAAGTDIAAPAQPGNRPQPGQGMMAHGKSNILVTRFHANTEFQALYETEAGGIEDARCSRADKVRRCSTPGSAC